MKEIKLTQRCFAIVDDEDFEKINSYKWFASFEGVKYKKIYAKRKKRKSEREKWKQQFIRMSHFVLNLSEIPSGMVVHHKNNDGLDNRKENLELVTQDENMKFEKNWQRKKSEENICL